MTSPLLKQRVADHLAQLARLSDCLGILGLLELDVRLQELRALSAAELRNGPPSPRLAEKA